MRAARPSQFATELGSAFLDDIGVAEAGQRVAQLVDIPIDVHLCVGVAHPVMPFAIGSQYAVRIADSELINSPVIAYLAGTQFQPPQFLLTEDEAIGDDVEVRVFQFLAFLPALCCLWGLAWHRQATQSGEDLAIVLADPAHVAIHLLALDLHQPAIGCFACVEFQCIDTTFEDIQRVDRHIDALNRQCRRCIAAGIRPIGFVQHGQPLVQIELFEAAANFNAGLCRDFRQDVDADLAAIDLIGTVDFVAQYLRRNLVGHADNDQVLLG